MCCYLKDKSCLLNRPASDQMCFDCMMQKRDRLTGLGDLVALTINTTPVRHIKPKVCNCTKRQEWLNRLWSFIPKPQIKKPIRRPKAAKPIKKKPCGCGKAKQNGNTDMERRR